MTDQIEEPMLQFFTLREDLQGKNRLFGELAQWMVATLSRNPERTAALRKLMEAQDCAARASIYVEPRPPRPELSKPFAR